MTHPRYTLPAHISDESACALALAHGYMLPKVLRRPNGEREIWAIVVNLFTNGVAQLDLNDHGGIIHRYCYENRSEAVVVLEQYNDLSQHPPGNWVKHKGYHNGRWVDDLNPNWSQIE